VTNTLNESIVLQNNQSLDNLINHLDSLINI